MYMNQNELYIDKPVNIPLSGIDETKSNSLDANSNEQTVTTDFPFSSPPIGYAAGIYRGVIVFTVRGTYKTETILENNTANCKGYLSLGGTYRDISGFALSSFNTSLTNIEIVSGRHSATGTIIGGILPQAKGDPVTQTYSGTSDLRNYVRVA